MAIKVSVIISAYNEEVNIRAAVESVKQLLQGRVDDYELLVFDDGSRDRTGAIVDELARHDKQIKVVHHEGNKGLAYIAKEGVRLAAMDYVFWFPGKNSIDQKTLIPVITEIGKVDLVVAYITNAQVRPWLRRSVSTVYTFLLNMIFGFRLRYYNGPSVYPLAVIKKMNCVATGYEFFAEMIIRSLKSGCTYREVAFCHIENPRAGSKALTWKNFRSVIRTVCYLFRDVYLRRKPLG